MTIPSEYIQIIAADVYAIALFYTVVTFRRTKKLDQITQINIIMADLRKLDLELAKIPSGSDYDDTRSRWHSRTFNTLNWLSFLINVNLITDKRIIEHPEAYSDSLLRRRIYEIFINQLNRFRILSRFQETISST